MVDSIEKSGGELVFSMNWYAQYMNAESTN
jgi:hypothetical protein